MIYIGIDPGTQGGVAVLRDGHDPIIFPLKTYKTFLKTKTKSGNQKARNELDVDALAQDTYRATKVPPYMWDMRCIVCIEKLTHGGKYADTTGQLMKNYGRLLATFEVFGVKIVQVTPQAWQKWCEKNMGIKARARATLSEDEKSLSIEYCREKYPGADLTLGLPRKKKPHDGCADALVLASWLMTEESEV